MKKKVVIIGIAVLLIIAAGIFAIKYLGSGEKDALLSSLEIGDAKGGDLKEADLTFYFEGENPKDVREVLDQVENKARSRLNVKLDFQSIFQNADGYLNKLNTIIASGQPCDAFYYSDGFPAGLKALADQNAIRDLTDIFPKYAPGYYARFSKDEIRAASSGDRIYAIPNHLPTSQLKCAMVRDDLMKKYNIPDIKSYDDYEVYLKAIKANEPDMIPTTYWDTSIGLFAEASGYAILDYQLGLVYRWDDPDTRIMAWEQTPEFKKSIDRIDSWYANGYLLKGIGAAQLDNSMITSGKWASFIYPMGSEFNINSSLMSNNVSWRYKAYPLYPDEVSARNSPLNGAIVVTYKSKNPERVAMFIEWLQSDQKNYDSLMYGIMGKHYTLDGNRIKLPENVLPSDTCMSWDWHWPFENIMYERVDASTTDEAVKQYYKTIEEKTKYPPHMGFVPDYGAVNEIRTSRQMSFYTTEQKIYTESFKPEDVDSYIKEQKDEGVDKLILEVQRQFDEWKAAGGRK